MKASILKMKETLEIDLPEMNLSVPNEKFNIAILGDKTSDTALRLLSLHRKRSTSLIQTRSDNLNDAEASKLFSIWEQNENPGKL